MRVVAGVHVWCRECSEESDPLRDRGLGFRIQVYVVMGSDIRCMCGAGSRENRDCLRVS